MHGTIHDMISILFALFCFVGVFLIARYVHLTSPIDPVTGRPVKYWQPWRTWSVAIVIGLGALYVLSVVILIAVDPGH